MTTLAAPLEIVLFPEDERRNFRGFAKRRPEALVPELSDGQIRHRQEAMSRYIALRDLKAQEEAILAHAEKLLEGKRRQLMKLPKPSLEDGGDPTTVMSQRWFLEEQVEGLKELSKKHREAVSSAEDGMRIAAREVDDDASREAIMILQEAAYQEAVWAERIRTAELILAFQRWALEQNDPVRIHEVRAKLISRLDWGQHAHVLREAEMFAPAADAAVAANALALERANVPWEKWPPSAKALYSDQDPGHWENVDSSDLEKILGMEEE